MTRVWHCLACHHEWEASVRRLCDWCGAESWLMWPDNEFDEMIAQNRLREFVRSMNLFLRGSK